jgi:23S rRNA (pseudouridine1915-N3)-methyltransferase
MKVILLTVGKTNEINFINSISDYQKRLKFYIPFELIELPELRNTKSLSEEQQKQREGEMLLQAIDAADDVVLLDDKGSEYTSMQFSAFMQRKMAGGSKRLVFVVGGPYGFSPAVYSRANGKISLSRMTSSRVVIYVQALSRLVCLLYLFLI